MGQKNSINKNNQDDMISPSTTANETYANENQNDTKRPAVNANHRIIIRDCFDKASCITAKRILMRINQQRPDFKMYQDNLTPEQIDSLTNLLDEYLSSVIENIDDVEKVKELSMNYGSKHVSLRLNGFKPDFFARMADAIAKECSFLSETAATYAPTNTFKAWTLLVDLMFSSVRDGFYQELRRQRRRSPSYLKSSRESSTNTEHVIGYPDTNIDFESDCCNNYDQTIISNNRLLIRHSLSAIDNEKRKFSDHRACLSAENILNREVKTTITTAISNPFFSKSISANSFTKLLPTTSSSTGTMDDNNRYLQMKSVKQVTKSCTPILNSINGSEISQSSKNPVIADNYDTNKYQNSKQFSLQLSQHATPKSFDPNRIIDDFMNDRYNPK